MKKYTNNSGDMDAYFATFNCHVNNALDKAIDDFKVKYSSDIYETKIAPFIEKGIMSIFRSRPNKHTTYFVETIQKFVNEKQPKFFTAGDWKVIEEKNSEYDYVITDVRNDPEKELPICSVFASNINESAKENAILISIAPKMYKALKDIVDWMKVKNGRMEFTSSEEKANELKDIINQLK